MKTLRVSLPTNVEIVAREGQGNTVIVKIPRSSSWLYGEKYRNGNWKVSVMDPEGRKRETVQRSMNESKFSAIISKVMAKPMPLSKTIDKDAVKKHIKNIIKKKIYGKQGTPNPRPGRSKRKTHRSRRS